MLSRDNLDGAFSVDILSESRVISGHQRDTEQEMLRVSTSFRRRRTIALSERSFRIAGNSAFNDETDLSKRDQFLNGHGRSASKVRNVRRTRYL